MVRTPVEEICLQVKALQLSGKIQYVLEKCISPPKTKSIENAVDLLVSLGALRREDEVLLPLGWRLSLLPIHPCLGTILSYK